MLALSLRSTLRSKVSVRIASYRLCRLNRQPLNALRTTLCVMPQVQLPADGTWDFDGLDRKGDTFVALGAVRCKPGPSRFPHNFAG